MNPANNFGINKNNFNSVAPNQNNFNRIDNKRFTQISNLNDINDLVTKGQSKGLDQDEYNQLVNLLKSLDIEVETEFEEIVPGKMPSILSSTDAYTKVFKALMEVLAKLREEEERQSEKIRNENMEANHEHKLEELKKIISKGVELMGSKEVKDEIITDKNFVKINRFFDEIREKFNIDIKDSRHKPINAII